MYYNLSEYHNLSAEYYSNYTYDNIAAYDIDEAMAVQFVFYSIVIPIISCIGITVFNIPRLFATHSKFHKFENSNKTYFTIENTEFGESNFFFYVYSIWIRKPVPICVKEDVPSGNKMATQQEFKTQWIEQIV
ncbi:hypothetical protein KUTeg_021415 [Tegillarca granosa]|uniref:CSC1/OSCA1-like N-terminal transmembrane domain-containing protein n=1 Tax=Tegillarca granosa TaxID=220873 RepID=A0ABQ9E632_TEGGR|nr:hypothetical protein KUTeg_021415 [Tegillarca granosa]